MGEMTLFHIMLMCLNLSSAIAAFNELPCGFILKVIAGLNIVAPGNHMGACS